MGEDEAPELAPAFLFPKSSTSDKTFSPLFPLAVFLRGPYARLTKHVLRQTILHYGRWIYYDADFELQPDDL